MTTGSDIFNALFRRFAIPTQLLRINISGFRQRLVLQVNDVFQRQLLAYHRAHQLQAVGFRKNQRRPARERTGKILAYCDQFGIVGLSDQICGRRVGENVHRRHRQQHLV